MHPLLLAHSPAPAICPPPGLGCSEPGLPPAPTALSPPQTQASTNRFPCSLHLIPDHRDSHTAHPLPQEGKEHYPAQGCQLPTGLHTPLRAQPEASAWTSLPGPRPVPSPPSILAAPVLPHHLHTEKSLNESCQITVTENYHVSQSRADPGPTLIFKTPR